LTIVKKMKPVLEITELLYKYFLYKSDCFLIIKVN
jgi:hypothetical protein